MPRPEVTDPGLARERTELAWNRSGLAVVVCVAVLLRRIWPLRGTDQVLALVSISAGAFAWGLALMVGQWVHGYHDRMTMPRAVAITAGTLAMAAAGLALALFPPT